jgi:murein DD-endopeptidase MepM/ murein hydrolase activator NlpD
MYRYRFDPTTLRYEPVEKGLWGRLLSALPTFLAGSAIAVSAVFATFYYLGEGPFQRAHLEEKNQALLEEYEKLNQEFQELEGTLSDIRERDDSLYRTLFGAEPIPENIRQAGIGGVDRYDHLRDRPYGELLAKTHSKLDRLRKKMEVQERSFRELTQKAHQKQEFFTHVPAIQPVREDRIDRIASGFGMRFHPIYRVLKMHAGIDFTMDVGTPVHVTGDGVVEHVERDRSGYGHNVLVDHGHGFETLYAHLSEFEVREGEKVKRGEVIGLSGNTGTSTGPHLHYEVIEDGKKVDPTDHFFSDLSPKEYRRVVKAAERNERSL